jgi:hypothetical protein
MKFPNLLWAIANYGAQYELARAIGCSESRFSRCLSARSDFTAVERAALARTLGFSEAWLFQPVKPPARTAQTALVHAHA